MNVEAKKAKPSSCGMIQDLRVPRSKYYNGKRPLQSAAL